MTWTAYIDGGARGNPGPAAAGIHIVDQSEQPVFSAGIFLGHKTNNEAEYAGLLIALDALLASGIHDVIVYSDSELLVRQMTGQYRVKAPHLKSLYEEANARVKDVGKVRFQHVPRERNRQADALVNQAIDAVADVIVADTLGVNERIVRPQVAASPKPQRTPQSVQPAGPGILVTVVKGPRAGICPAKTKAGQTFRFTNVTPAGMCVEACSAVVDSVVALASACDVHSADLEPMTITCSRPDCGAVFQLKPAQWMT